MSSIVVKRASYIVLHCFDVKTGGIIKKFLNESHLPLYEVFRTVSNLLLIFNCKKKKINVELE